MSRVATFQCSLDNFFNVEAFSDGPVPQVNATSTSLRGTREAEGGLSFTLQQTLNVHSAIQLGSPPSSSPSRIRQGRPTPRLRPIMPAIPDGRQETTVRIMLAAAEQASRTHTARSYLFSQPQTNMRLSEILMDLLPTEEASRGTSPTVSYLAGLKLERDDDKSRGGNRSGVVLDQRTRAYPLPGSQNGEGKGVDDVELPPSLARDIRDAGLQATRHRQAILALRSKVEQNLQIRMEQGDHVAGEIFRQAREQDMLVRTLPEGVSSPPRDRDEYRRRVPSTSSSSSSSASAALTSGSVRKTSRVRRGREGLRPMTYQQLLPKPVAMPGGEEDWEGVLIQGNGLTLEEYFNGPVREDGDAFSIVVSSPSAVSTMNSLIMDPNKVVYLWGRGEVRGL